MSIFKRIVIGRPIATADEGHQRISKKIALPVFASDALSSVAYAPEEIFLVLSVAGLAAFSMAPWIGIAVGAVMLIVIAYPIYYTIDLSFFDTPPGLQLRDKKFIGFANYTAILTSALSWRVTWNTLIWTLGSTFFSFVLGFAAALALPAGFETVTE